MYRAAQARTAASEADRWWAIRVWGGLARVEALVGCGITDKEVLVDGAFLDQCCENDRKAFVINIPGRRESASSARRHEPEELCRTGYDIGERARGAGHVRKDAVDGRSGLKGKGRGWVIPTQNHTVAAGLNC